jgi:hypothetical protein
MGWSWWFVFAPFWIMTGLFCYANYQSFSEVQQMAMEKDPTLFGLKRDTDETANYGAVGKDGDATPSAANEGRSELTVEEQEELKAQVMASSSRLCSKCCSQGFLLLIVVLFVGKIQGAGYSAVWIISPFLFVVRVVYCILKVRIFLVNISNISSLWLLSSFRLESFCAAWVAQFLESPKYLPMV